MKETSPAPAPLPVPSLALLLLLAVACALLLLLLPRATPPRELPHMLLPKGPVEQALRDNRALAAKLKGSPAEAAVEELLVEQARVERDTQELAQRAHERHLARVAAHDAVVKESGEQGMLALRAASAERLRKALALELPDDAARDVLGGFPNLLAREGCTHEGTLTLPYFVAHVLYLARFNVLFGKPPYHALARIELRAFHGVSALHAERLSLVRRIEALHAYGQAGGTQLEEALGVLLFRKEEHQAAAAAWTVAYEKTGNVRLRNYAQAALAQARRQ